MAYKKYFLGLPAICCCLLQGVSAQQLGVNRPGIQWQQINQPAARIIFPQGQDSLAQRVANLATFLVNEKRGAMGQGVQKIGVVLQSENTLSNAYVGLGPYRSELYLTPPQEPFQLGANGWADQLIVHEFRHVQQFNFFNTGVSRFGGFIAGQYGRALANNAAVPDWFWEGDAIMHETRFTTQGRGRLPYFFNPFKSLDAGNRKYSLLKLRNGSFKDYIPNHYDFGYLVVAYVQQRYGDSIWLSISKDAASFKGVFYPWQNAVKRHLNIAYSDLIDSAFAFFYTQWRGEKTADPEWLTQNQPRNVVDYIHPYPAANGSTVVLKRTLRHIPRFIWRNADGTERSIAIKDIGYDDYYGYNNGKIVYAAYGPDIRWRNREYSDIRLLDTETGRQVSVTAKTRYFSPDIDAAGANIVAVEVMPGRASELHHMDTSGNLKSSLKAAGDMFFSHPKWLADGQVAVATRNAIGHMGWLIWQPQSGKTRWLMEPAERLVGFPVVQGDTLVFTCTQGGYDQLIALEVSTAKPLAVQRHFTGIYQGFLQNGQFTGSVFTDKGFRLGRWAAPMAPEPALTKAGLPVLYIDKNLVSVPTVAPDVQMDSLPKEPYRKSFQLFNLHSWIPQPNEPDYRFTFIGENVLSTLNSEIFYNYNTNESSHGVGTRIIYGDSYIMPFVSAGQTWGRNVQLNADTVLSLNETELGGGLILPLILTKGKYARSLTLTTGVNYEAQRWTGLAKSLIDNGDYVSSTSRLVYIGQLQRAPQHIYPRFGQTLIADYRTLLSAQTARQLLLSGGLYLPGLLPNHHLVLTAAYQARDTMLQYLFSNSFPFSRGYNDLNFPRMWRIGVNYHFPLFYPDWGFAHVAYIRRIRANVFADFTRGKSLRTGRVTPFNTVGSEVFLDMRFWNVQLATIGVRYSHLLNTDLRSPGRKGLFEVILPIDLFGR